MKTRMIKTDDLKKIAEILEKENCDEISEQQLIARLNKENEIYKEVSSVLQGLICAVALEMASEEEDELCSVTCDNCKYYALNNPPHSAFRLENRVNHIIATVRGLDD